MVVITTLFFEWVSEFFKVFLNLILFSQSHGKKEGTITQSLLQGVDEQNTREDGEVRRFTNTQLGNE